MQSARSATFLAIQLLLFSVARIAVAQSDANHAAASSATSPTTFEPLEAWKAAVLAGDKAALQSFYFSGPDAYVPTPAGKISDPASEEPAFWSGFHSRGLVALSPKILERTAPRPGTVALVLRIEMTFSQNNQTQSSLVSAAQLWVNRGDSWRILATQRGNESTLPTISLPQPAVPNTNLYPDPASAPKDLDLAMAAARKDRKRVLVVFGANWCYDCHVLDATLRSRELAQFVAASYLVVHVSIGDEGKDNAELAQRLHVPVDKGIPSLAVLDGDGRLITSQQNGEFESAAKIGMDDVSGFLNRWKPEQMR